MMVHAELGLAEPDPSGEQFSNNAAYIASWLRTLKSDRKEVFRAAADAQRIADYLLAFHPGHAASNATAPPQDGTEPASGSAGPTPAEAA